MIQKTILILILSFFSYPVFTLDILPGFTKNMPERFLTVMFENEPTIREDHNRRFFHFELVEGEYGFQEGAIELMQWKSSGDFLSYSLILPPTYENVVWALNRVLEQKLKFHRVSDILMSYGMYLAFEVLERESFYYIVIEALEDRLVYSVQFHSPYM